MRIIIYHTLICRDVGTDVLSRLIPSAGNSVGEMPCLLQEKTIDTINHVIKSVCVFFLEVSSGLNRARVL